MNKLFCEDYNKNKSKSIYIYTQIYGNSLDFYTASLKGSMAGFDPGGFNFLLDCKLKRDLEKEKVTTKRG